MNAEQLAQQFHEAYERLAPSFGYETREASAKPWAEVPENNRNLMIAVCQELLDSGFEANDLAEANERIRVLNTENQDLHRKVLTARTERDALQAALTELKSQRVVSAVFSHHAGAPRPFALRGRLANDTNRETLALGAEWPDGAVALRFTIPGLEGGWHTRSEGGVDAINAGQQLIGEPEFEVIWLSDEIETLAEAAASGRAQAAADVRKLQGVFRFPADLCRSPYWNSLSGPSAEGYIEWCARIAENGLETGTIG